jgi:membrane protein implicated in regulation of membrane protease activity
MPGKHVSTKRNWANNLKSVVWLLQLTGAATAILLQLALVAYLAYALKTQPSGDWPLSIGIVAAGTAGLYALARYVERRLDRAEGR